MKQVKIAYQKCKEKLPNRPPDEFDFGLGFRAALEMVLDIRDRNYTKGIEGSYAEIEEELK